MQLAVPLPDTALRREQLTVLTRGMLLAEDVRLDDVADRTLAVAADLAALAREPGSAAALCRCRAPNRSTAHPPSRWPTSKLR